MLRADTPIYPPHILEVRVLSHLASMPTILLIIVLLLLFGALPTWPYSSGWGYYPSGLLGLVLIVLLVMVLTGRRV